MNRKDDTTVIPSTRDGHAWRVYPYKPENRAAPYVSASEVELWDGGYTMVLHLGGGDERAVPRVPIVGGRMTKRAIADAKAAMVAELKERGYIAPDWSGDLG